MAMKRRSASFLIGAEVGAEDARNAFAGGDVHPIEGELHAPRAEARNDPCVGLLGAKLQKRYDCLEPEAVLKVGVQAFLHGIGRTRVFALDFLRGWAKVYLVIPHIGCPARFGRAGYVVGMTAGR